ncbi:hypothetical protein RQP46_002010 [Phenoliferia psychrophenolica]
MLFHQLRSLPATVWEWREAGIETGPAEVWAPLAPFFLQHGYTFFKSTGWDIQKAPSGCPPVRAADPYHCWTGTRERDGEPSCFRSQTAIQIAARSAAQTDVVIRLIKRAGDPDGDAYLKIIQALSSPEARRDSSNRTLPVIEVLELEDMVFGVFPMMRPNGLSCKWFETAAEVFSALDQVLSGFVYLHGQRIAHSPSPSTLPGKWRSRFDAAYFINDFEWSVQFPADSPETSRLVTGMPFEKYFTLEEYGKPLPPEVSSRQPYCPFRMDVYQVGQALHRIFKFMKTIPDLLDLFLDMINHDPVLRPTALEALQRLRGIEKRTPIDILTDTPSNGRSFHPTKCVV